DGDGRDDLAVVESSANAVTLFMSRVDGSFAPGVDYAVGKNPLTLAVGDFNGDGRPDIATATIGVSVLLNRGDGTFLPRLGYAAGADAITLIAGDFAGNGRAGLAVLSQTDPTISVLLAPLPGDANGDGRVDLGDVTLILRFAVGSPAPAG